MNSRPSLKPLSDVTRDAHRRARHLILESTVTLEGLCFGGAVHTLYQFTSRLPYLQILKPLNTRTPTSHHFLTLLPILRHRLLIADAAVGFVVAFRLIFDQAGVHLVPDVHHVLARFAEPRLALVHLRTE